MHRGFYVHFSFDYIVALTIVMYFMSTVHTANEFRSLLHESWLHTAVPDVMNETFHNMIE